MKPLLKYIITVICWLTALPLSAQRLFIQMESNPDTSLPGGLCADNVWQAPDSGYYVVGQYYHSLNDRDIYLARTDKDGRALWLKLYGGVYGDLSGTFAPDSLGITLAMNLSNGTTNGQTMLLLRCDTAGNVLFSRQYGSSGSEEVDDIIAVTSGGYLLAGATQGNAIPTSYNGILIRVDSNGDTLWTSEIDGPNGPDIFRQAVESPDAGFVTCGYTTSFGNGYSFYVVKVDSSGNLQWTDVFTGPTSGSFGMAVASLADGSILAGGSCDQGNGGVGFLTKLDTNGDSLWTASYSPLNSITHIISGSDGKIAITGHCNNWSDGYIAILDSNGNVISASTVVVGPTTNPMGMSTTYDGGYMMAGFQYVAGYKRTILVKTDSLGNTTCSQNLSVTRINPALTKLSGGTLQRGSGYENIAWSSVQDSLSDSTLCYWHVGVHTPAEERVSMSIYPNPSSSGVSITFEAKADGTMQIVNLFGQRVYTQNFKQGANHLAISKNTIGAGFFTVILEESDGMAQSRKFVLTD